MISGLVKSGENVSWDVVTGISAGSIITAATGLYAVGQVRVPTLTDPTPSLAPSKDKSLSGSQNPVWLFIPV